MWTVKLLYSLQVWFVPSTKGRVDGGWVSRWVSWWVHFEDKCRTGNDPAAVSLPQVNGPGYNWHSPPPAQCLVIFLSHHSTLFSLCRTFEEDPGLSVALCPLVNRCYPPALKWSRADELTSRDQAIARLQMDRRLGPGSICLHWRSNFSVEYHQLQVVCYSLIQIKGTFWFFPPEDWKQEGMKMAWYQITQNRERLKTF